LAELAQWAARGPVRGEITVVLAGADGRAAPEVGSLVDEVDSRTAGGERLKDAVAAVAERAGVSKRELYAAVVAERVD
jgi:16S rRNA (cytidine1402-2'-O)-methyltransferase